MAGISITYPNDWVYFIVDNCTKYAMVMKRSIKDLTINDIEGIDLKGYYFSTEEKAMKNIKYNK